MNAEPSIDGRAKSDRKAAKRLAKEHGVGEATIRRDAGFAAGVDKIEREEGPAAKAEILSGKSTRTKQEVIAKAKPHGAAKPSKTANGHPPAGQAPAKSDCVLHIDFEERLPADAGRRAREIIELAAETLINAAASTRCDATPEAIDERRDASSFRAY